MKTNHFFMACMIVFCVSLLTACEQKRNPDANKTADNAVKIRTSKLIAHKFDRQIHVQGNIKPLDSAVISAKTNGTLDALNVKEGDTVKKDAILFQIDHENQKNLTDVAAQAVEMMKVSLTAAELDLQMAETTKNKAEQDYNRSKSLVNENIVSKSSFEAAETAWKNATFQWNKAKSGVESAKLKVEEALLAKKIADKVLADSTVKAPYDAIVTSRKKFSGEFVGAGTPVLTIESLQEQEISAYISAIYYNTVNEKTPVIISFAGAELCRTTLTYKSPSVDPLTRTFEIKAKLPKKGTMINGTLCDITLILAEREGIGIRSDAVLARAGGKNVVFTAEGETAKELEVETGLSTDGITEILNSQQLEGKPIIVSGQYYLNDGAKIINMDGK